MRAPRLLGNIAMDLSRISPFEALVKRLAWLGERPSVLAQDVANADMPDYTAKDLKPPSFAALVIGVAQRVPLRTTAPGHLLGSHGPAASSKWHSTPPRQLSTAMPSGLKSS